jgi:hypothetical protein
VGRVKTLQDAFVWVDKYGVGGGVWNTNNVPAGYGNGTTEGYSEYRIFLKRDARIDKIVLSLLEQRGESKFVNWVPVLTEKDTRDCISIELYGAGVPGSAEKTITRVVDPIMNEPARALNYSTETRGLISLHREGEVGAIDTGYQPKYKALVLWKNITIMAGGASDPVVGPGQRDAASNLWGKQGIGNFLTIGANSTVIMNAHSKIRGYYAPISGSPVLITHDTARFYMYGGIITGNASKANSTNPVSVESGIVLNNVFSNQGGTVDNMTKLN